MITSLRREKIVDRDSTQSDVLDALIDSSQPDQNCERAWWVMFYSVALKNDATTGATTHNISKLKGHLWSAFNDVRFLLHSSILNVEALIAMALFAEEHLSPQACWSLISKACTMLIDLGIGKLHQTT
jgi:hypothetical protein